jgi:hypothetical protein
MTSRLHLIPYGSGKGAGRNPLLLAAILVLNSALDNRDCSVLALTAAPSYRRSSASSGRPGPPPR